MTQINLFRNRPVAVIGAGVMGIGIVQVALLAGHPVRLYDVREGAAAAAAEQLAATLAKLADKGKLTPEDVAAARGRLHVAASLDELRDAALVIEAIVENLAVKQALMRDLEAHRGARLRAGVQHLVAVDHRRRARPCSCRAAWWACTSSTRCR